MSDTLSTLCKKLNVTFNDISLLRMAITHASLSSNSMSYERREFVGDRVVGLAMAEILYKRFPTDPEGDLARRHSQLVRCETLAAISRTLNLGEFIRMASGEENTGGRDKDSLLSDSLEAVVAAIYFDQGLSMAQDFIEHQWEPYFNEPLLMIRDYKTSLQELVQAKGFDVPTYETVSAEGPAHAPEFTVKVLVKGMGDAEGIGSSKRKAEQVAASHFIEKYMDTE